MIKSIFLIKTDHRKGLNAYVGFFMRLELDASDM